MKILCGFQGARGPVVAGLALLLSLALIQPMLTTASERKPMARTGKAQQQTPNGKAKKVTPLPPELGVPYLNLPNLDEVRQRQRSEPQAPAPIQSTIRSPRKSAEPASGKKSHHGRLRRSLSGNSRHHPAPATPQSGPPPFTNDPLKNPNDPDSFKIQAVHITELRAAINIVRNRRHLPNYSWVKPTASSGAINTNVLISWEPIDEMRTALDQAIGPPPHGYASGLGFGLPILADHIQELRERVKDILGVTSIADQLVPSRIDLFNQSGNSTEARDCEWSLPLVSLPGRAGLDLNIGLSYSSMVWTQAGSYISFDDDWGDPSPGFKIGFPTIQGRYTNNLVGANVYILITSAGRRVELRRVGSSNIYEAGDSSYLQLIDNGGSLLLRTTDGTQMSYAKFGSDWHCTAIEDRNGNFISANYNSFGDIVNITDTLGRTFTFQYDGNYNLQSITQTWTVNGVAQTHTWATFGWGTVPMHPAFSGVTVVGVFDGEVIPVLTQVGLPDGSHYNFEYNSNGQATAIRRYTDDAPTGSTAGDIQRAYTAYDYDTPLADCPRITHARVFANNWSDVGGVPHEVITNFADNHDRSHQMTTPDGTVYKEVYGGSGDLPAWQHGLVTSAQVITGSGVQKTTTTWWTQDNEGVNYQTNPRVSQTLVSDGTNNRKTTISYQTFSLPVTNTNCSLPNDVSEYDSNQSTVLRHTYSHYKTDTQYLDNSLRGNRLIGLQDETDVYQGAGTTTLVAKITYAYDQTAVTSQARDAVGHDQSYDTSSAAGIRGNVTAVSRWDVNTSNTATTTSMTYDAAGNLLTTTDASSHTSSIGYTDSFSDGNNHNTFAYPTTLTDADNNSSYVQYNFEYSAKTRTQRPPPGNPGQYANGIIQTFSYDEATRLKHVTTVNTGAYVHYEYGPDYTSSFASVNSVAANYWESDSYTNQFVDGLGRVFALASNHPNSTGQNKGQYTRYDQMGRAVQQTNPFEMDGGWNPTGDDAAGYQFNVTNTFDWKGRPLRTYNMDGTFKEASYAGCGCAGGELVTLTDEGTVVNDQYVFRTQKNYSDTLGRQWKTEVLNFDGSVYSTMVSVFNARDQVKFVNQYAGAAPGDASSTNEAVSCPSGSCQQTTMSYDGYGRLYTKHVPKQQDQSGNPTHTSYSYFDDDTVNTVTDGRGAVATYGYNGRHQVRTVSHVLSGYSTISVGYEYDAAGNRVSMAHSVGGAPQDSASYGYDSLSRMTSETRHINALGSYGPNYGDFTIGYTSYTPSNQLQAVTDPFNATTNLSYDNAGRTNGVTGSDSGTNFTYVGSVGYRAWDAVKNRDGATTSFNSRMQPIQFRGWGRYDYTYYDDGRLKQIRDLDDLVGDPHQVTFHYMSRLYSYDQAARITSVSALNPNPNGNVPAPFTGYYGYDAFNNMNSRSGAYALNPNQSDTATYTNNRRNAWNYDNDGRVTTSSDTSDSGGSSTRTWSYDAAGNEVGVSEVRNSQTTTNILGYDGDGQLIYESVSNGPSDYLIRSAVLGSVLTKLDATGNKNTTYVPTNGLVMVLQQKDYQGHPTVSFVQRDALGLQENGQAYDPFGNLIQNVQPPFTGPPPYVPFYGATWGGASWSNFVNANNFATGCELDGRPTDCNKLKQGVNDGWLQLTDTGLPWTETSRRNYPPGWFDYHSDDHSYGMFVTGSAFDDGPQKQSGPGGGKPSGAVPCDAQDFTFAEGANGMTAAELSAVTQVAVGESDHRNYNQGEASAVIDTIENRLSSNIYGSEHHWTFVDPDGVVFDINPFVGRTTSIAAILTQYDAARTHSGSNKINQEKQLNGGILPAGSIACKELLEARSNASRVGDAIWAHGLFAVNRGINSNMGPGAHIPSNFQTLFTIGPTQFGIMPTFTPRPR
jgi:YD repeat-containing protein